jgi:3-methylfumaryl-CoA hydratase
VLDPTPVFALASLFDDVLPAPRIGDVLPPLWHWVALPRWSASSQLSSDGHPFRGSFLPPVELPRRMFAGGTVSFPGELRVGDTVRRESVVESVTEKNGRSGYLVIVVVATKLFDARGHPALIERQTLIYREAAAATTTAAVDLDSVPTAVPTGSPFTAAGDGKWDFHTDPTLLMRFSAASSNAHRIHYDWPYATQVEGYPGLVVHGPLMTLALAETHRLAGAMNGSRPSQARVSHVAHRNSAPLFCGQPAHLHSIGTKNGVAVDLFGPGGVDAGPHTTVDLTLADNC